MTEDINRETLEDIFETDAAMERDGVWVKFGNSTKVKLGRAGGANKRFEKVAERVSRPYRRMIANEQIQNDLAKEMMYEVYAEGVVFDWETYDKAGVLIPFSKENVIEKFNRLHDFFLFVKAESDRFANFRKEQIERDAKN